MGILGGVGESIGTALSAGAGVKAGVDAGGDVEARDAGGDEDEETGEDRLEACKGDVEDMLATCEAGGESGDTKLATGVCVRFETTMDTAVTRGVGGVGVGEGVGAGVAAPGLGEGSGDPTFDATCRSKCFKLLTIPTQRQDCSSAADITMLVNACKKLLNIS